jgi:hypothetical protein
MGPEAINLCKQLSNLTGEGPEGLKRIFELFSIGFQTNRGKIGFYDEGGPESRTGARCEDGDRTRVEIRVEKYLGSDSS